MGKPELKHRAFVDRLIQPGDIVLSTTPESMSRIIRKAIGADISHAMICVGFSSVIDSTGDGVHARNLSRIVLEPGCAGHVLRPVQPLTPDQLSSVIAYARGMIGTRYSKTGAAKSLLAGVATGRRQFCSRLVGQAYGHAGILLVDDPDFCHPGELLKSPLLVEVSDVLVELTTEQAAYRREDKDNVQEMRDGTNALLEKARVLSPGIESLNDIDAYLIEHPEANGPLVEALQLSGYLELWRGMVSRSPWQYDITLMEERPLSPEQMQNYCTDLLAGEQLGPNRFLVNRAGYVAWHTAHRHQYFAMMAELYTLLAELHAQRVMTATTWLERRGLKESVATELLRPHTPEWFQSQREWDPRQAAMVEMAIKTAGSDEVCSVCADAPASDFVVAKMPPAGPGTIRLCDFCFRFRSADEPMKPFP